jgi:hypothetical protein
MSAQRWSKKGSEKADLFNKLIPTFLNTQQLERHDIQT